MNKAFAMALLYASATARLGGSNQAFDDFNAENNKNPTTLGSYLQRLEIFTENQNYIDEHNNAADPDDPQALILGMNWTGDLTPDEMDELNNLDQGQANQNATSLGMNSGGLGGGLQVARATNVDHAADGVMHPVKNQGGCGSCWAFSANTALEGTLAKKYGEDPLHISEQQIVDCTLRSNPKNKERFDKQYQAYGCRGGWMSWSWDFHKDQGFMMERDYPYTSGRTGKEQDCAHKEDKVYGKVTGWEQIRTSVDDMKDKLQTHPLAVALYASSRAFQFYKQGVVKQEDNCGTALNHAVVIVGYSDESTPDPTPDPDTEEVCEVTKWWHSCREEKKRNLADVNGHTNYWKVQNSWGTRWGDEGFILIEIKDGDGVCGINKVVQYVDGYISENEV